MDIKSIRKVIEIFQLKDDNVFGQWWKVVLLWLNFKREANRTC